LNLLKSPRFLPIVVVAISGVVLMRGIGALDSLPQLANEAMAFAANSADKKPKASTKDQASKPVDPTKGETTNEDDPTNGGVTSLDDSTVLDAALAAADIAKPAAAEVKALPVCATSVEDLARRAGVSPNEIEVLQQLAKRREALDARERTISDREALIAAADAKLAARIGQLGDLKKQIEDLLVKADKTGDEDIARLTKVYENMKPKDAAPVMARLSDDVRLPIAAAMKDKSLAAILSAMPEEKAQEITEKLALRMSKAGEIKQKLDQLTTKSQAPGARPAGQAAAPSNAAPKPAA
jgi:flagellar motility protein MotE (MotC chaperone)